MGMCVTVGADLIISKQIHFRTSFACLGIYDGGGHFWYVRFNIQSMFKRSSTSIQVVHEFVSHLNELVFGWAAEIVFCHSTKIKFYTIHRRPLRCITHSFWNEIQNRYLSTFYAFYYQIVHFILMSCHRNCDGVLGMSSKFKLTASRVDHHLWTNAKIVFQAGGE